MGLKDILVPYNGSSSASHALAQALSLASERDGHVTGCFPYEASQLLGPLDLPMSRGLREEFRKIAERLENEARKTVEARFFQEAESFAAQDRLHCLKLAGNADLAITKAARHYDLTVLGARAHDDDPETRQVRPDVIALRSGKPVLIVPGRKPGTSLGRRVVIAWDGKRAAARTVGELLQLFGPVDEAFVLRIGPPDEAADYWSEELFAHFARHDSVASPVRRDARGSIARTILGFCDEVGADLLAMGAYEHSKFSEDVLGGTTNDILKHLNIPVFMAH